MLQPQRSPLAPELLTLTDTGSPAVTLPTWQAVFGPPQMATEVAERLAREVARALQDPALRTQLEQQALHIAGPGGRSPA